MTCTDARDRLPLRLTGDLAAAEAAALDEHLAGCPGCRAVADELAAVHRYLADAPAPSVPLVDVAAIYQAAAERACRSARRWRRVAMATAAGLIAFAALPRVELRWKSAAHPPAITPQPDRVAELESRLQAVERLEARLQSLDRLVAALDAEAAARDGRQQWAVEQLALWAGELQKVLAEVRHDQSSLYTAVFPTRKPEGVNP